MGKWSNDMKNGPGCVVTLDGVYYEGTFSHSKYVYLYWEMFDSSNYLQKTIIELP